MARLSLRGLRWKCESQARLPHTTLLTADEARSYLTRQFETAWKLTNLHLDGLATDECL